MRLKDIGKNDSFDRMINALKYSVDQMTNSGDLLLTEAPRGLILFSDNN
jgi:hypothetical protein